jgi:hypothetical protein
MAKERWPSLMLSPAGLSTKESRFDSRGSLELSFTPFCSPQLRLASFTGWLSRRWCGVVWSRTDPEYLMRTIAIVAAELLGLARSPLSSFFFLANPLPPCRARQRVAGMPMGDGIAIGAADTTLLPGSIGGEG